MNDAPVLIERNTGGWLATTPDDYDLRFAVDAADRATAEAQYASALARWRSSLARYPSVSGL